jgi:ribosomal-protein-alanine N-acetyltransferase
MLVPTIITSRLELASMSPSFLEALLSGRQFIAEGIGRLALPRGWPDEHDERWLRVRLQEMRDDPLLQPWLARAMVLKRDRLRPMVGHIGFHGAPKDGSLELGYTVIQQYRRQGYAFEAALGMMDWASREHGISRFLVSISPENQPSLALADKMGFKRIGEQVDPEDGLEYVFELNYAPEGER